MILNQINQSDDPKHSDLYKSKLNAFESHLNDTIESILKEQIFVINS
jgi:hypothetical protein